MCMLLSMHRRARRLLRFAHLAAVLAPVGTCARNQRRLRTRVRAHPGCLSRRRRAAGRGRAHVDAAALRLRDSILTSAETEGLTYQAYWLSTTLALGAFLKARPP